MKRLALFGLFLGACGGSSGKSRVDLTLELTGKAAGQEAAIQTLQISVDGDVTPFSAAVDATGKFQNDRSTLQYVAGATSGRLTFRISVLDPANSPIGSGGDAVDLKPGQAVELTIKLGRGGAGDACKSGDECVSTHCSDGVCCDAPCDGICESCAVSGSLGTCTAIPANTDPEHECGLKLPPDLGAAPSPDFSASDGGVIGDGGLIGDGGIDGAPTADDGGLHPPDGGITIDPSPCAGTCSGNRSCTYPGATTACGSQFCNSGSETASFTCDGMGGCGAAVNECSAYACTGGACGTGCTAHSDCQADYYCSSGNQCLPRKGTSVGCSSGPECQTGYCVNNVCCESSCDVPGGVCNKQGAEGMCICSQCATGPCQIFYKDADADGYGDPDPNKTTVACVGATVQGYVTNSDDCDDDPTYGHSVHPHQNGWFTQQTHVTFGGYDYNCSKSEEKRYPEVPKGTCGVCQIVFSTFGSLCTQSSTCTDGVQPKLDCNWSSTLCLIKPCYNCCGCADVSAGFDSTVKCGASGNYVTCPACTSSGVKVTSSSKSLLQGCH